MSNHASVCPRCGAHLPEPNAHCAACGATMTPTESLTTINETTASATRDGDAHGSLPPIYLPVGDHGRLAALARTHLDSRRPVARFLSEELERAVLCAEIPDGVVTMGSRILFRIDGQDRTECRTLVYPQEYHPTGHYVSILSPVGVALLGLKAGDHMPFLDLQAAASGVTISDIAYQPGSGRGTGTAKQAAI